MTAKCALCVALLSGKPISIKTGFDDFGITNIPREIGRSIEREKDGGFGVTITKREKEGLSRWGVNRQWFEYHLEWNESNKPGIQKMLSYVKNQVQKDKSPSIDAYYVRELAAKILSKNSLS